MKNVQYVIYRYLTGADFFNIYKPTGTEEGGGGQTYIDFLTSKIPVDQWNGFFRGVAGLKLGDGKQGPSWSFPMNGVGISQEESKQEIRVYQRRPASICIAEQNPNTRAGNRVKAWSEDFGFPAPRNPKLRTELPGGLVVFLIRTYENEIWAGWYLNQGSSRFPFNDPPAGQALSDLVKRGHKEGDTGIIQFSKGTLFIDETNATCPFYSTSSTPVPIPLPQPKKTLVKKPGFVGPAKTTRKHSEKESPHKKRSEEEISLSLFGEDEGGSTTPPSPSVRTVIVKVIQRNKGAVKDLKELYRHACQITGYAETFVKRDGKYYTEAHHLIPLGQGGFDNPLNMVIVSPKIHRMLHYANVSEISLSDIKPDAEGYYSLPVSINGEVYVIRWHAEHASRIKRWGEKK